MICATATPWRCVNCGKRGVAQHCVCGAVQGCDSFPNQPTNQPTTAYVLRPLPLPPPPLPAPLQLRLGGLLGGHSGLNIHEGRGNAVQLMARVLAAGLAGADGAGADGGSGWRLVELRGGDKRNAIAREAAAAVLVGGRGRVGGSGCQQGSEKRNVPPPLPSRAPWPWPWPCLPKAPEGGGEEGGGAARWG